MNTSPLTAQEQWLKEAERLIDEHGGHRWETGCAETENSDKRYIQQCDKAAVSARAALLTHLRTRPAGEAAPDDHPASAALSAPAAPQPAPIELAEPVAWRARGYGQYKTGQPGPWGYKTGAAKPTYNNPECCDIEPLYAAPQAVQPAAISNALLTIADTLPNVADCDQPQAALRRIARALLAEAQQPEQTTRLGEHNGGDYDMRHKDADHAAAAVGSASISALPALLEAVDSVLETTPCDCSDKRRYEAGSHLSHCHLFDLNIARNKMLASDSAAGAQQPHETGSAVSAPSARERPQQVAIALEAWQIAHRCNDDADILAAIRAHLENDE